MQSIPESHRDLFEDQTRAYAYLATTMADGSPQVTPIWFNADGEHVLINSTIGRVKDRNMRSRPKVALLIMDPRTPYHYVQIRGPVVEITDEGGVDHIKTLSKKYTGSPVFDVQPGDVRVIYKILPERVFAG